MGSNVELGGLSRWDVRHVTVNTAAIRLDSTGLDGRNGISIKADNGNSGHVFVGPSSSVSATVGSTDGGYGLRKNEALDMGLSTRAAVWAKGSAAGQVVYVLEVG